MALLKPKYEQQKEYQSVLFDSCPAKTYSDLQGRVSLGRNVPDHCQIVGEVAKELMRRFPKPIQVLFPEGSHLIAAAHDIGKVSPYFFEKLCRACSTRPNGLPVFSELNVQLENQWGGHAGVSQLCAKALGAPEFVPEILGQHHGFSPQISGRLVHDEFFGREPWQEQREELVNELVARLQVTKWPCINSVSQARLLAGLTTVSDWIGSGEFFENPLEPWQKNIGASLDAAGFITPTFRRHLSFENIFGFSPRVAQSEFIKSVTGDGVYVLEAPMGLGKTEAALYAGYRLLTSGKARGIYFALPTQLTSNRIFYRFNAFLEKILSSPHPNRALLLHGNAHLLETELGEEGRPGGAWFHHAKRGLLAPFAVGTIDQALMAAMNVKHGFVRAFGMAGKVVILDEVHTYDAYTGTILDALVELLTSLKCTVLILSATLNQSRREQILNKTLSKTQAYPLVTSVPTSKELAEISIPPPVSRRIRIQIKDHRKLVIPEALNRASDGQQVLWIENTVKEAQETYLDLAAQAAEIGVECGLIHSRFTQDHRKNLEDRWIGFFGKEGWQGRNDKGRILVGTQVLEQSLDIDADFLVSNFAPTDLLLQRLGRLWRHDGTPRIQSAQREAWWIAPSPDTAVDSPESSFGGSAFVYSPFILCRSLEVWHERFEVSLPENLRSLIESTYEERIEHGKMIRWKHDLEQGSHRRLGVAALRQLANITLSEAGITRSDTRAPTRYSETDSLEVLLVRTIKLIPDHQETRVKFFNGDSITLPWYRHRLGKTEWRQLSVSLMKQTVYVLPSDAPIAIPKDTLRKYGLHHCFYLGDPHQEEALLRVARVDEAGGLHGLDGGALSSIEYRQDLGYRITPSHGGT